MQTEPSTGVLRQIPRSVWVLGCVSLLMDVSSEIIHSLLPMFLMAGRRERDRDRRHRGIAEATAPVVKVFSGTLSDYLRNRKWLAVAGYAGALSKPLFAIAPTLGVVVTARIVDRIGKGIRGAPRDALVADVTPSTCVVPPTGCVSRSIRWARSSGRFWPSSSCWGGTTISASHSGWP